jgi:hypothetical protein
MQPVSESRLLPLMEHVDHLNELHACYSYRSHPQMHGYCAIHHFHLHDPGHLPALESPANLMSVQHLTNSKQMPNMYEKQNRYDCD